MSRMASVWQRLRGSEPVPAFGVDLRAVAESPAVDVQPMIESFQLGYRNLQEVWGVVLPPATLLELKKLDARSDEGFGLADTLWARMVSAFALAHRTRAMDRNHLLQAMTPLYLGWVASYALQVRDADALGVEQRIEALCMAYEAEKGYLISRWRWPDRFNP